MRIHAGEQTKWHPVYRCDFVVLKRVWEHKNNLIESYTSKYGVHTLVWYELHDSMESAIQREKVIKNWKRIWKLTVIEKMNSNWHDLYSELF